MINVMVAQPGQEGDQPLKLGSSVIATLQRCCAVQHVLHH